MEWASPLCRDVCADIFEVRDLSSWYKIILHGNMRNVLNFYKLFTLEILFVVIIYTLQICYTYEQYILRVMFDNIDQNLRPL